MSSCQCLTHILSSALLALRSSITASSDTSEVITCLQIAHVAHVIVALRNEGFAAQQIRLPVLVLDRTTLESYLEAVPLPDGPWALPVSSVESFRGTCFAWSTLFLAFRAGFRSFGCMPRRPTLRLKHIPEELRRQRFVSCQKELYSSFVSECPSVSYTPHKFDILFKGEPRNTLQHIAQAAFADSEGLCICCLHSWCFSCCCAARPAAVRCRCKCLPRLHLGPTGTRHRIALAALDHLPLALPEGGIQLYPTAT